MQPVSAYNVVKITQGDGTTVVRTVPTTLHNLFMPITVAGTAIFYDTATATGTAATNEIFRIPNVQGTPLLFNLDYQTKNGLVAVTSGTVNFTLGVL